MGPLSGHIGIYKNLAENAKQKIDEKPAEDRTLYERSAQQILSAEIENLDKESKLLEAAGKTRPFVKFLKAVGLALTSPFWILPYLIKKLFVKENSQEQRIRNTLINIFPHLDAKVQASLAPSFIQDRPTRNNKKKSTNRTAIQGGNGRSR